MLDLPFAPSPIVQPISSPNMQFGVDPAHFSVNQVVSAELQELQNAKNQPLYTQLSAEEYQAVVDKMVAAVRQPAGHLPRQEELYLEQQLADMLGFEVAAELEGVRLNHSLGIMKAQPHLRRHPTDDLAHHDEYREAGLSPHRSAFGWFTEFGQLTPKTSLQEKYFVTVQADFLPEWTEKSHTLKPWFKFRKMIVINPVAQKAVVSIVGDIGPSNWMQEQFGGSPEVIRAAEVWNLDSQGRVMMLFVNDPGDQVPLGPIDLLYNKPV